MKIKKGIDMFFSRIALFFIFLYQKTLSPDTGLPRFRLKGRVCAHEPHCSEYAKQCFQRYGFLRGLHYTLERVSTCVPSYVSQYDPSSYSVVFFSGAPLGVHFLQGLYDDTRFEVTGVVTMPDAPTGRGMKIQENPVKKTAQQLSIEVQTPHSLRTTSKIWASEAQAFHTWLEKKQPDFLVVVAYGNIVPQEILDLPRIGPINVHGSLLPKYRGASPLQSVFLHNEQETGMTIMRMNAALDEGNMIDHLIVPLGFTMTVIDLIQLFQDIGPSFLQTTLWKYGKGLLQDIPQDHSLATHTTKITKEDACIDIHKEALDAVWSKYKAYALWPKIYFLHKEKRVVIEDMLLDEEMFVKVKDIPLVDTTYQLSPAVKNLLVKPEGKKTMSRDDFVHGYVG